MMPQEIKFHLPDFLEGMEERMMRTLREINVEQKALTTAQMAMNLEIADQKRRVAEIENQIRWAKRMTWSAITALAAMVLEWIRARWF